jgi:hypothetical protein
MVASGGCPIAFIGSSHARPRPQGPGHLPGEPHYGELALRLVDQVHHVLGRHRPEDPRTGWISGLPEAEGEAHPTRGGLRIGKPLPERSAEGPFDERLEWDRDGQYFHYLTKWMHALESRDAIDRPAALHDLGARAGYMSTSIMTEPSEVQPPGQKQDDHDDQDDTADAGRSIAVVVVAPVGQATEDDEQQDDQ